MAFRVIQQSLWTDEKIIDNYSCEDKYFWLYLLTNPQTNQLGIYKLPTKLAAFQLGYSREQVIVLLDRFEKTMDQIRYNKLTQEIAIGNFLYHSVIRGGKPVIDTIEKDISKVTDVSLFDFVIRKLSNKDITNHTILAAIEKLKEKSNKKENITNDNDNDNDNDNGDTHSDTLYDTPTDTVSDTLPKPKAKSKPKKITLAKSNYGEYSNVLLTDEEYNKLLIEIPNASEYIEKLSSYMESTGKTYKSHIATIRNWFRNDKDKGKTETTKQKGSAIDDFMKEMEARNGSTGVY